MSLDRLTVSPRRLLLAGVATGIVAMLAAVVSAAGGSTPVAAPPGTIVAGEARSGGPPAGGGAGDEPAEATGPDTPTESVETAQLPADPAAVVSEEVRAQEVAAHQVAADFASAYASHRFDDAPSATVERVRPFVTDELAAELASNSGAEAGRAERAARQEEATASVQAIQHQAGSVEEGRLDVLVVVRQEVTSSEGAAIRWPSYVIQVARAGGEWRVARLLP